ncbi:MAG: RtcB family protein [Oscillospiraceae bacterium]|jgi:RNA-splicing ligase RtcB|nr:RtcB family protein [Oscillospiraceae bacterium]
MIEISGIHNSAICYTTELEVAAAEQIKAVCDREEFAGCKIRIMPDVHAGMGCTIGTTMTVRDKIVPGMVGVDIGCGIETLKLAETEIDFEALDRLIRREIPSGRDIRTDCHPLNSEIDLNELCIARELNLERAKHSIGTLGGGNHFIEVARADKGDLYLIVHSGSRHLGTEVAGHYQDAAYRELCGKSKHQIEEAIAALKAAGREREISGDIIKLKAEASREKGVIPKDLAYVSGQLFDDYIHDMKITQCFAALNRRAMAEVILRGMGLHELENFTTIHNYIDTAAMILRKGAVSAKAGERLLIPIHMRDGSMVCVGKGNDEWNRSAPHGAGRLMSRKAAFASLSMAEYVAGMINVFTTSINSDTLDESPMAYKSIDEIISHIAPTVDIVERLRPIYNFKANN